MSKGSITEINRDIKNILNGVFNNKKNYNLAKSMRDVYITEDDLLLLSRLLKITKEFGKTVINHQRILYAFLIHAKRYSRQ